MKDTLLTVLLVLALSVSAIAQKGKTFFHTFNVSEINTVELQIPDEIVIEKWVNKTAILIETNVQLSNIPQSAYRHIMEKSNRYELTELDDEGTYLTIAAKNPERKVLRTQSGDAVEEVHVTVYIPQEFELQGDKIFVRKTEGEETTSKEEDKE